MIVLTVLERAQARAYAPACVRALVCSPSLVYTRLCRRTRTALARRNARDAVVAEEAGKVGWRAGRGGGPGGLTGRVGWRAGWGGWQGRVAGRVGWRAGWSEGDGSSE